MRIQYLWTVLHELKYPSTQQMLVIAAITLPLRSQNARGHYHVNIFHLIISISQLRYCDYQWYE